MDNSSRNTADFGKGMECIILGKMLLEGLDVYIPLVDDNGVDCVIKKANGTFIEVQIKARSRDIAAREAALFSRIEHDQRKDFFFVFYSEQLDSTWILSSKEFLGECSTNLNGKHAGKRIINFGGVKTDRKTRTKQPHRLTKYDKYLVSDFSKFH